MTYWVLTDSHFGHGKMRELCDRPVNFAELILEDVKRQVKQEDILIHLGDFSFYDNSYWQKEFMSVCRGKKWLIKGNHDKKSSSWYLRHGWDFVCEAAELKLFGKDIILSHKPIAPRQGDYLNVHGHLHNPPHNFDFVRDSRQRLVYIEHEYKVISLRDIVERKGL